MAAGEVVGIVPWIQGPSPWGPRATPRPAGATTDPGGPFVPTESEFPGCESLPPGPGRDLCLTLCGSSTTRSYPWSPDGCCYVNRQPDGRLAMFCGVLRCFRTDCGPASVRILDTPADVPPWVTDPGSIAPPPKITDTDWGRRALEQMGAGALGPFAGFRPFGGTPLTVRGPGAELDLGAEFLDRLLGGAGRLDLTALVRILAAGLQLGERIRGTLRELAPQLLEGFDPRLQRLALALTTSGDAQAAALRDGTAAQADATRESVGGLAGQLWDALIAALEPILRGLGQAAQAVFAPILDKMRGAGEQVVQQILRVYSEALEGKRPITPANVPAVAGVALANAIAAGTAAQSIALGLEMLHPTKRLGLNQVVGFLADFAGFGQIAGSFTGPTLKYALAIPGDARAASLFRTRIPAPGEAREQAFQRHISLQDYAGILAMHGFPSWWVRVLVDDTFVDPTPRELATLLEDGEADPVWLATKLREVGWDDGDVARGVKAWVLKQTTPGRQRLLGQVLTEYREGRVGDGELEGVLEGTVLREEHRGYWRTAAKLSRRGDLMDQLGRRIVLQYRNDVVSRASAEQQLAGLGYVPSQVNALLLQAELDREVKQLTEQRTDVEAQVRQIRTAALTNLKRQFRAGFVPRAQAQVWGEGLGFAPAYIRNVLDLEELAGPPSKAEALPPIGLGAVREAAAEVARLLADQVQRGKVNALAARDLLQGLGLSPGLARELVGVAQVLGLPVPGPLGIPLPGEGTERLGWESILAEVLRQIHGGGRVTDLLGQLERILGLPPGHTTARADVLQQLGELALREILT
ncbi:MAG: hypothetical protein ACREKK_00465 [Candidatus Methylomirabilales bacterium]